MPEVRDRLSDLRPEHLSEHAQDIRRVTWWGLVLNVTLVGGKLIIGVLGNTQALIADGVHSVSDLATDFLVLFGVRYWSAPADADHPHGHGRIETVITFVIGGALAVVGLGLAYRAVAGVREPHETSLGWVALAVACASIVSKELLYQWTAHVGKHVRSPAVIANAWHHRSDALSSLPVAITILGSRLRPAWTFLDHIGALIVSVFVVQAAWAILWPAARELADAGASEHERERLRALVASTAGVKAVHALRTRRVGPGLRVDLHILVNPELSVERGHQIAGAVKERLLRDGPDVVDVLVHIEPFEAPPTARNRQG